MCIFHSMNTSENQLKGFCDRCYSGNKDNSRTCSILDKNTYKQAEFTSAFRWCSSKTVSENGCNFRPSWLIPFSQQCTQNNGSASKNTELLPSKQIATRLYFFSFTSTQDITSCHQLPIRFQNWPLSTPRNALPKYSPLTDWVKFLGFHLMQVRGRMRTHFPEQQQSLESFQFEKKS